MSLNATLSSATSATGAVSSTRWPGASGSTRRISAVSRSSGPNTRRISTTFTTRTSATPAASTSTSLSWICSLTVAGEMASATTAATSTAALIATTRQKRDTRS